ncbi:MAG: GTP cyclohydrolase I FolE [Victivallaceae bacterium]|nr:GTP cyclohydrolase I FolE [Victivallaceae bacterium]
MICAGSDRRSTANYSNAESEKIFFHGKTIGVDKRKMQDLIRELILKLGENPDREGLLATPERVERSLKYLTRGYSQDLDKVVNHAIFEAAGDDMVIVRDIEFFSLCEHHLLPFFGRCHVGYIPNRKIIGVSKIGRIVDMFARRLQIQERLTHEIGDALMSVLDAEGVGVVMEARHLCMQMRGVEKQNSVMTTSAMQGSFRSDAATRSEFMKLIR